MSKKSKSPRGRSTNPPPSFVSHPQYNVHLEVTLDQNGWTKRQMIENNSINLISDFAEAVLDEPSPNQLLSHVALKVLAPLDCRGAILGIVRQEGFLDLVGSYGFKDSAVSPFTQMPLWTPLPITDAARTGETSILATREEMVEKYPHLSTVEEGSSGCTVSIPLNHRSTIIGAIGFTSMKVPPSGSVSSPLANVFISLCSIYVRNLLNRNSESEPNLTLIEPSLTPRQKQIIKLFNDDLTTEQMADKLRYSASTIKQDIIKIYAVFGVSSRTAVYEMAKKAGIVEAI